VTEPHEPQTISYPAESRASSRYAQEHMDPHVIVLFGATGDLARRKLLPGLAHLVVSDLAPEIRIVGTSLEDMDDAQFKEFARTAVEQFAHKELTAEQWDHFDDNLTYVPQSAGPGALAAAVRAAEQALGDDVRRLH
jgi:glucose-6-phosphate 1-dehydrogenase